uniref:Uncharacterized protein n=1 Tax=Auxenochlorella protothecoides TaxID=3075 RepID=A0A1D2A1V1_AUXPR
MRPPRPPLTPPTLSLCAATDWATGTTQTFYIYHQLATKYLYQVKCSAPVLKATGLPALSCTQVQDNSATGTNVKYEVALTLINMSGATVKASGPGIPFTISVATLGGA